jgi:predicted membrane-bound spermidine synthase
MLSYLKYIRSYEIIAFVTGFALMAYELAASRILAPSIGSSTYVWTSVIGVIIAALSVGYAVGGIVADKRTAPSDIAWLLLASGLCVVMTLVFAEGTLAWLSVIGDSRLQGLLASLFLFTPASFALGMISPYLARLRTPSLAQTGKSVASLSALNAIGGIVGTFCVGFIFFGYIGSNETLAAVSLLLIASSWLIAPRRRLGWRIGAIAITLAILLLQFTPKTNAQVINIDTPTSHYQIFDGVYKGQLVRVLTMGPGGSQSGVFVNGSNELVFDYTRQMAELTMQAPKNQRILLLGGGAFTIPNYLATQLPSAHIDVVEIDPKLTDIAKQYFNYRDHPNVRIISQDARAFLNVNQQQYDIILVDAYSDTSIPFAVATVEYADRLRQSLTSDGVVIVNIIGAKNQACLPLLNSLHTSYASAFSHHKALPQRSSDLTELQNIVVAYSNQPLPWIASEYRLEFGMTLTDNFAPVERLQQQCVQQGR